MFQSLGLSKEERMLSRHEVSAILRRAGLGQPPARGRPRALPVRLHRLPAARQPGRPRLLSIDVYLIEQTPRRRPPRAARPEVG
jgi:hypothetical protein